MYYVLEASSSLSLSSPLPLPPLHVVDGDVPDGLGPAVAHLLDLVPAELGSAARGGQLQCCQTASLLDTKFSVLIETFVNDAWFFFSQNLLLHFVLACSLKVVGLADVQRCQIAAPFRYQKWHTNLVGLTRTTTTTTGPTNNALLINFRLSSDAQIFVAKRQLSIQIGAKTCKNMCATRTYSDRAPILHTTVGSWVVVLQGRHGTT